MRGWNSVIQRQPSPSGPAGSVCNVITLWFVLVLGLLTTCTARADRVDDLIHALSSPSVSTRDDAAQTLARVKSRRAVPGLIHALGDPVEAVRGQAIRALAATLHRTD